MRLKKGAIFDTLLNAESVGSLVGSMTSAESSHRMLKESAKILGMVSPGTDGDQRHISGVLASNNNNIILNQDLIPGLDINEDFVSDASSEDQGRMKKAQYEMD